jgi:hypothetical protein
MLQVIDQVRQELAFALVARRLVAGVGGAADAGVNRRALGAGRLFEGRRALQPLSMFMQRPCEARFLQQSHPPTVGQNDKRPSILDHDLSPVAAIAVEDSLRPSGRRQTDRNQTRAESGADRRAS